MSENQSKPITDRRLYEIEQSLQKVATDKSAKFMAVVHAETLIAEVRRLRDLFTAEDAEWLEGEAVDAAQAMYHAKAMICSDLAARIRQVWEET